MPSRRTACLPACPRRKAKLMHECEDCGKKYSYPSGLLRHKHAHGHGVIESASVSSRSKRDKIARRGRRAKRRKARAEHTRPEEAESELSSIWEWYPVVLACVIGLALLVDWISGK